MSYINYVVITDKYISSCDTENQWYFFSSLINKGNLKGTLYLKEDYHYYDIKSKISDFTCLPYETIIEIGDIDNGNSYVKYTFSDYDKIKGHFNEMKKYGGLYIYVDINKSKTFKQKNNVILENDRKIKNLEQNYQNSINEIYDLKNKNANLEKQRKVEKENFENSIQSLKNQYNNLKYENQSKINELMNQNKNLRQRQEAEKNEFQKNINLIKKENTNLIKNLEQNYQNSRNEINDLKNKNANIVKQSIREKENLENSIQSLKNQYDNLKSENQSKINELMNQNKNLKQRQEEEKNEFQKNIDIIKNENTNLRNQCDNLRAESQTNKAQITDLKKKQTEEENKKLEEEKKFNYFEQTFEKDKQEIENKNLKESKNKITEFIINDYIKPFFEEEVYDNVENGAKFTISLKNNMIKFVEEFLNTYCQNFIQSFKVHSKTLAQNYDVKSNKFQINHINFIVIGQSGTGKSTFINSSLLLSEGKKAKEGEGMSVTEKSTLYSSEKLLMIRMWDTQGLDYEINQDYILNEVKRLVNEGLQKGPDNYINIILYCTTGNRFQKQDGELIRKIMQLYPMDNLPVIITQLQVYFKKDQKRMENIILKILKDHLESNIAEKIPIKTVISKDKIEENVVYKAKGIPELLKCSFELTGRAITSATFKKFSEDIKNLCKEYVDNRINFILKIFANEMEILNVAKSMFKKKEDKIFNKENNKIKTLSDDNIYNKNVDDNFFYNNFKKIMKSKIIDIYNNLNGTNISYENNEEYIVIYVENKINSIMDNLNHASNNIFEVKYKKLFNEHLSDLTLKQSSRNTEFKTKYDLINASEINNSFKKRLFQFFQNEFLKYFFCIILHLFMNIIKDRLLKNYREEILENKEIQKIINSKAEDSLKSITERLKSELLVEVDKYFPNQEEDKKNETESKNNDVVDVEFNF